MKKFFRQMMMYICMLSLLCADGRMLSVADAAEQEPDGYQISSVKLDETKKKAVVSFEAQEKAALVVCVFDEEGIELCFSNCLNVTAGETQAEIDMDTDSFPQSYFLRAFLVDSVTLQPLCRACSSPVYTDGMQGSVDDEKEPWESLVTAVSLGSGHSGVVTEDGSLYMWGDNRYGQLGNGTTKNQTTPVKVLENVVSVSLGSGHSGAVTEDGSLYMWGMNLYGQLGIGTYGTINNQTTPVKVLDNVVSVSLGDAHSGALTKDGSLYMWGGNAGGQLGNGTTEDQTTPVKVLTNVVSVSLGGAHSGALTKDGNLYMWGYNMYGQLGDGAMEDQTTPVKVLEEEDVVSVSLGGNHSGAITEDGSLYMWGRNYNGELGNGTTDNQTTPVKVLEEEDVVSVSLGGNHSGVITEDGSLYMWGRNYNGEIGDGTTEDQTTPVKVLEEEDVVSVSLRNWHSGAVTSGGSLYMWGQNDYGQLGDGTTINCSTPTRITIPTSAAVSLSFRKQYSKDTGNQAHDSGFVSDSRKVLPAARKNLMNLEYAASLSAVSTTGGRQTAGVQDLEPDGIYNFYILRSLEEEDLFGASNVLYMNQYTADRDGNLNVTYKATSACDAAIQLVVGFGNQTPKITNITLSADDSSMNKGTTLRLIATIDPKEAANQPLKWTSGDPAVATVDDKGLVTAKGVGKTTITAETTDGSGIRASCVISVREAQQTPPESVTPTTPVTPPASITPPSPTNPTTTTNVGEGDLEPELLYYVVKFHANGGTKLSRKTMTLLRDDNLGILPSVERKNYKFTGWYTQRTGGTKVHSNMVLNASTTVFAHWTKVGRPAQAKLSSVEVKSAGKLQMRYKKVSGAFGYEIAYSTSSKFASSETKKVSVQSTSKLLTGLKKNKVYYVKVRAYKVDSTGRKIYGKYSIKKKVSTKK